jgi:hypothetical protein
MKQIFYFIAMISLLAACRSSKHYLSRSDGDKALFDAVKKLNKKADDADASKALPVLYTDAQQRHLNRITEYNGYKEINRWDNIITEYTILQRMYDAITASSAANKLVRPANYQNDIYTSKQGAAEEYYQQGISFLNIGTREYAKNAYNSFKQSAKFVSNYKDSKRKMDEAYQSGIVDVVINPVADNSFFFNSGWGNAGYNYSNEYFQQTLIRELGGANSSRYPARFYTEWEARRENIKPDWVVDLTLRNLDIPRPTTSQSSRNASKQIEKGRDSTGKILYETVYATLTIYKQSFNARADMDVNITEVATRKNIAYNSYNEYYNWQDEYATYSGDKRALSDNDLALINNRNANNNTNPRKEDVLNELYRKLYPQVKNRIVYSVDW